MLVYAFRYYEATFRLLLALAELCTSECFLVYTACCYRGISSMKKIDEQQDDYEIIL